ncbi:hypothetical protein [Psychroflexus sp. ALD_RP9]|uniref:hypothetical protein n=1 Tax=Psychroflexus sp. ALD_RP9 TaxID=2777186 RepID=UPI001A8E6641|nr:hypothetical protein [Psychroflexus sp. ALD_RP9]QSS96096.1 hypothetical protein IMZ30_06410 [Psychroflexus sp. ALD_RP9]
MSRDQFIKQWEQKKKKGILKFIYTEGLVFAVIVIGLQEIYFFSTNQSGLFNWSLKGLLQVTVVCLLTAIIYTALFWPLNTYLYQKYKRQCKK